MSGENITPEELGYVTSGYDLGFDILWSSPLYTLYRYTLFRWLIVLLITMRKQYVNIPIESLSYTDTTGIITRCSFIYT